MPLRWLPRVLDVRRGEGVAAALSFVLFFSLLSASYVLRPIREALGVEGGVRNYAWLFTGTFVVTLALYPPLGALASRTTRTRFAVGVFGFIAASLIGFRMALASDISEVYLGRAFFIWLSVFNVVLTSVFWGVMADVFTNEQGRRLFGAIAAGGTAGALAGSAATSLLVRAIEVEGMLLVAASLIAVAMVCVVGLSRGRRAGGPAIPPDPIIGGKILAGLSHVARSRYLLTISAYILFLTATATFVYFQQGWIVEREIASRTDRTAFFGGLDLATNAVCLLVQVAFTRRLIRGLGVTGLLAALPIVTAIGFAALAFAPILAVFAVFQLVRRTSDFALARPAREILFTVVDREDKFKAKNVVDVVVYRGGDAAVAWLNIGLSVAGFGLGGLALVTLPVCALWAVTAGALGRMERRRRDARSSAAHPARQLEEEPT